MEKRRNKQTKIKKKEKNKQKSPLEPSCPYGLLIQLIVFIKKIFIYLLFVCLYICLFIYFKHIHEMRGKKKILQLYIAAVALVMRRNKALQDAQFLCRHIKSHHTTS